MIDRKEVFRLRRTGHNQQQIAEKLGVRLSTVANVFLASKRKAAKTRAASTAAEVTPVAPVQSAPVVWPEEVIAEGLVDKLLVEKFSTLTIPQKLKAIATTMRG